MYLGPERRKSMDHLKGYQRKSISEQIGMGAFMAVLFVGAGFAVGMVGTLIWQWAH